MKLHEITWNFPNNINIPDDRMTIIRTEMQVKIVDIVFIFIY